MGGSDQWALQAPLREGREVIAVDLPGFGRNAHLEPIDSIGGFARWVLGYLEGKSVEVDEFRPADFAAPIVENALERYSVQRRKGF